MCVPVFAIHDIVCWFQFHFRLVPHSKYQLKYIFVPLLPGNSPLPRIHINMVRYPGTMDNIIQAMLPSHVFVMVSIVMYRHYILVHAMLTTAG